MSQAISNDQLLSEFAGQDFVDPDGRLPIIQAYRGTASKFGYFVPFKEMAKAGWGDFDEKELTTCSFDSGVEEIGLLLRNPRMLVCPKSPVLAMTKPPAVRTILGPYYQFKKSDRITNLQVYQIILLDAQNNPLHSSPLAYKAKGANQASFSVNWQQFCSDFNTCFSMANRHLGISPKPKNNAFNSLLVFQPKLARELVGDEQKSPALRVVGYEAPTLENWQTFFVGMNPELKNFVWQSLAPKEPMKLFGAPAPEAPPALPAGVNDMPF